MSLDLNSFLTPDELAFPTGVEGPLDLVVLATGKDKASSDEILELVLKVSAVSNSDKEPGTLFYRVTKSVKDNDFTVGISESYKDKAAFEAHLSSPEFQALAAKLPTHTAGLFAKWTKEIK